MHTRRSVFLKHEDAQERDSGKVLQPFNSSRHYLFNNKRKRLREQSDFHGQKLGSCPEGRKDHKQWFLCVSERDAKKQVWQLEKQEKSCSFYLIYFVCFYTPFYLSVISSSFLLSLMNVSFSFYTPLSTETQFFLMFPLSAFPVPLSYTLNTEPQQLPNFPTHMRVHSHFGHFCVHLIAVLSPVVLMFYQLCRSYWKLITSMNIHSSALKEMTLVSK